MNPSDSAALRARREELMRLSRHHRAELAARFAPHGRPSHGGEAAYPRSRLVRSMHEHPRLWGAAAGLLLAWGPGRFMGRAVGRIARLALAARGMRSFVAPARSRHPR